MKPYICTKNDWDYEVIDVFLVTQDEELHLKGFDDVEWREANSFAERIADSLNIEFVGDRTTSQNGGLALMIIIVYADFIRNPEKYGEIVYRYEKARKGIE